MKNYRRLWEQHHGPIPVDEYGYTYEIHHINGDHEDNRIENLKCVSIKEHFDIHYEQGDTYSCLSILRRMKFNIEHLESKAKGMPLCGENHPGYRKPRSEETRKKISENHHDVSGKNNPMYGRTHTEEARKIISEKNKGKHLGPKSEETKKKMSKAKKDYWDKNKNNRVRKIKHNDKIYNNAHEAAQDIGCHPANVRRKCRMEKYTDWEYA